MKRCLLSLFLLFSVLFCFVGCGDSTYPPIESTEAERATVMTLIDGDRQIDVPLELYRTLFLTYREELDGGDATLWQGENAEALRSAVNDKIFSRVARIYAVLSLAKEIGFDPYGTSAENKITEYIKASVDGGYIDGMSVDGYGGDYDAYLASLARMHMNYSVQTLLLRYLISLRAIEEYYQGSVDSYGNVKTEAALKPTEEELSAFYYGEESVRVLWVFLDGESYTQARAEAIRNDIAALQSERAVAAYMINHTTAPGSETAAGHVIGRYTLSDAYYAEITEAAFSLSVGRTSEAIAVATGTEAGYYILYRAEKSAENYAVLTDLSENYIENRIGETIHVKQNSLKNSAKMSTVVDLFSLIGEDK